MDKNCAICKRIGGIQENKNPYFVKELDTSYVVLSDHQFYRGYTVVLSKVHARELHELPKEMRNKFLSDMALTAQAVFKGFKPVKLNYELLGNTDTHLHWHIIPRHKNDPSPKDPIWIIDKTIRYAESTIPNRVDLNELVQTLRHELDLLVG